MLKSLLSPYSAEQFLMDNWTKQAVYIPALEKNKFAQLFSWQDLNYLLNFHKLQAPQINFSLDGQSLVDLGRQHWRTYLQQGATLVVNGVDETVPAIVDLARSLSNEIGHPVQTNLYCSPAMQRGFSCHFDTHDVLILQIEGKKEWFVFPETVQFPTSEMRLTAHQPPDLPPYLQCTLQQGDVLYIPRGHWHYAISCDRPSLHLTIGIDCCTGLDWLNWLNLDLQEQSAWRQNLPLACHENTQDLEQHLEVMRQDLITYLQQPDLISRYIHDLQLQNQAIAPFSLPTQLGFNIFDGGLETEFVVPPHQRMEIAVFDQNDCQITVGSKQISVKGLAVEVVEKLFQQDSFSILDLADWSPELDLEADVIPLLTRLVTAGVLLVK